MATLVIMRGLYGSGKSTWVKKHYPDAVVCSADDFFLVPCGSAVSDRAFKGPDGKMVEYKFDIKKLGEAHQSCLAQVLSAMMVEGGAFMQLAEKINFDKADKRRDIVVDNTHGKRWEYENYVRLGMLMGYRIRIVEVRVETIEQLRLCAKRQTHNVPPDKVGGKVIEFEYDERAEVIPMDDAQKQMEE
jgi:predicted kinase